MYMNNPRQGLPTRAMPNQQGAPQPQGDSGAPTASPAVMPGMQQAQGQGQPWDNSLQMLRHQMTGPLTPEQKAQQARDGEHYLAGIGKPPRSPQELLDSFQARPAPTNGQGKEFRNGNPFANARGEMRQPYRNMGNQVNGVMQQFGGMNPYSQAGGMDGDMSRLMQNFQGGGGFGGMGGQSPYTMLNRMGGGMNPFAQMMGGGGMNPFMGNMMRQFGGGFGGGMGGMNPYSQVAGGMGGQFGGMGGMGMGQMNPFMSRMFQAF